MKKPKRIPFCPLPIDKALRISQKFKFMAQRFSKISPNLELTLDRAKFPLDKMDYMSIAVFSATFMSLLLFGLTFVLALIVSTPIMAIMVSLGVGVTMFAVVLIYTVSYPKLLVKKRINDMERNLLNGLKHMLIQIRSGVPLFESFISLAEGGYGTLSEEFADLVKSVNTGSNIEDEMNNIALMNPSPYLRRALWQISNGIKAGSDMSSVLNSIIEHMSKEQTLALRRYGSQLNPLTLVYMMVAVIIPAMGITMLIVLSSFSGMEISENMLLVVLFGLSFLQFMYMGIIKSRRPNI